MGKGLTRKPRTASVVLEAVCCKCGKVFKYRHFAANKERSYCSRKCSVIKIQQYNLSHENPH